VEEITLGGQRFEFDVVGDGPLVVAVRNVAAPVGTWPTPGEIGALRNAGLGVLQYQHLGTTDTIEGIAADVARLIEHVDRGPVVLWGWSQGAMSAQELALARPDLVSGAVMMATRGRLTAYDRARYEVEARPDVPRDAATMHAVLQNHTADSLCDDDLFERVWSGYGSSSSGPSELGARANRAGAAYADRLDALRAVTVPCMVVAFSHDVNIPPVLNREVADAIPDCRYVEIQGAGHSGGVTHRHEVRGHVLPFFRSCVGPPR
jgi:pimeloyl-ACP methyl ester carboxylesterase